MVSDLWTGKTLYQATSHVNSIVLREPQELAVFRVWSTRQHTLNAGPSSVPSAEWRNDTHSIGSALNYDAAELDADAVQNAALLEAAARGGK